MKISLPACFLLISCLHLILASAQTKILAPDDKAIQTLKISEGSKQLQGSQRREQRETESAKASFPRYDKAKRGSAGRGSAGGGPALARPKGARSDANSGLIALSSVSFVIVQLTLGLFLCLWVF